MPPPTRPAWNSGDWDDVEARMNTRFPDDFKDFISTYGSGRVSGYLNVVSPFKRTEGGQELALVSLIKDVTYQLGAYVEDGLMDGSLPVMYPHSEGLLLFGTSADHHEIFWKTEASPEQWDVVVFTTNLFQFDHLPGTSMTKFIYDLIAHSGPLAKKGILVPANFSKREFVPLP